MARISDRKITDVANEATAKFKGDLSRLESAIGAMYIGKYFGWKVLYLAHDKKTLRKYEEILGISFRESFPEEGPRSKDSMAIRALEGVSNFWKAVKGEIKDVRSSEIR